MTKTTKPGLRGGVSPTLNVFDNAHETRATVVIAFDNSYRDGLRIQRGNTINTLSAKMGTGGNNVPFVAQETTHDVIGTIQARSYKGPNHENARDGQLVIQHQDNEEPVIAFDGYNQSVTEDVYRALRIGIDSGDCVAIPIQGTIIGRADTAGPQGRGAGEPGDPMYTLDTVSQHGVEHMMQVRRLTPLECERLMGWPDNHTATGTTGPVSDTNRYKMCGNGVASPVAQWIGEAIMGCHPNAEL